MNSDLRREYAATLKMALDNCHPADAVVIVCDWLGERRQIGPIPYLTDLYGDAKIWVAATSPLEHFAYLGAIIIEMGRKKLHLNFRKLMMDWLWHGFALPDQKRLHMAQWASFSDADQKRLFMAKWTSFSDANHKAFLARVASSEVAA